MHEQNGEAASEAIKSNGARPHEHLSGPWLSRRRLLGLAIGVGGVGGVGAYGLASAYNDGAQTGASRSRRGVVDLALTGYRGGQLVLKGFLGATKISIQMGPVISRGHQSSNAQSAPARAIVTGTLGSEIIQVQVATDVTSAPDGTVGRESLAYSVDLKNEIGNLIAGSAAVVMEPSGKGTDSYQGVASGKILGTVGGESGNVELSLMGPTNRPTGVRFAGAIGQQPFHSITASVRPMGSQDGWVPSPSHCRPKLPAISPTGAQPPYGFEVTFRARSSS